MPFLVWAQQLHPLAQQCLKQNQLTPLQKQIDQTQQRLEQDADKLAEYLYYLRDGVGAHEMAVQFNQHLSHCRENLNQCSEAILALYMYIDTYKSDDWETRFGQTHFYDDLIHLRNRQRTLDVLLWYYISWDNFFLYLDVETPTYQHSLNIHEQQLESLAEPMDKSPEMLYWRGRLLALDARRLSTSFADADKLFQQAAAQSLPPEYQWRVNYEQARLALWQNHSDAVRKQLKKLDMMLVQQQDQLIQPAQKRIYLTLLQGELQKQPLAILQQLLCDTPDLRPEGQILLGIFLARELMKAKDPNTLVHKLQPYECIAAAQWLSTWYPSKCQLIALLWEACLNQPLDDTPADKPTILFHAGQSRYQLIDFDSFTSADRQNAEKSVRHWLKLAGEHTDWSEGAASSLTALTAAADIALRLQAVDTQKYALLTNDALSLLVGRFDDNASIGPFASTPAAQHRRYHFGLLLENQGDFATAAQWFAVIPADDANIDWAQYHAIYCRYQLEKTTPVEKAHTIHEQWIKTLSFLTKTASQQQHHELALASGLLWLDIQLQNPDLPPATVRDILAYGQSLIAHASPSAQTTYQIQWLQLQLNLYHRLADPIPGLNLLQMQKALTEHSDRPIAEAGLAFLVRQNAYLWSLLRHDQTDDLRIYLQAVLPVNRDICYTLQKSSQSDYMASAQRLYLEHLALMNAYAQRLKWEMSDNASFTDESTRMLEQASSPSENADSIWFLRVQGLKAYSQGDYPSSLAAWQKIRAGEGPGKAKDSDSWWFARIWSLRCLAAQERFDELRHVIDVLRRSQETPPTGWVEQINTIYNNAL